MLLLLLLLLLLDERKNGEIGVGKENRGKNSTKKKEHHTRDIRMRMSLLRSRASFTKNIKKINDEIERERVSLLPFRNNQEITDIAISPMNFKKFSPECESGTSNNRIGMACVHNVCMRVCPCPSYLFLLGSCIMRVCTRVMR